MAFVYIYLTFLCLLFNQIAYFPYTNVTFICLLCTQMAYFTYTNVTSTSHNPSHCHVEDSPRRLKQQTLRAMPLFQKKVARDYVKMDVDMGDGNGPNYRSYFGRCMCFFRDANGDHFVALRWLAEVPGVIIDHTTRLAPLTLSPAGSTDSYSVMSCAAIRNGAVLMAAEGKLYPVMPPCEEQAYRMSNCSNKGPSCFANTQKQ